MRTDITPEYLAAFEDSSRWRIQYLVFHWLDGDQYVAGSRYEYAPGLVCDALVTDWGSISDAVDPEAFIGGTGNATRQANVKIANTSDSGWWCSKFAVPPENTVVDLYQAVEGIGTPLLVGRFIMQSTIRYSEASPDAEITLLSVNQAVDPYVGTLDSVTNNFFPVTIGAVSGVPGALYGSNPIAKLDGDVAVGATIIKTDRPVSPAGFPASGELVLDFDVVTYTGVNGVNFTGCSGVTKSHDSGQYVFKKGHEYIFAFGAGPVDVAGPVYVDGDIYNGNYTIYKDRNPVQAGFLDGFPWRELTEYGSTQIFDGVSGYITHDSNGVWPSINGSQVGVRYKEARGLQGALYLSYPKIDIDDIDIVYLANVYVDFTIYKNNDLKFYTIVSGNILGVNVVVSSSSGDVINKHIEYSSVDKDLILGSELKWKLYGSIDGFARRAGEIISSGLVFHIEYAKLEPGYPKKVYFDNPSINIGVSDSKANPADVISWLHTKKGCASYIDSTTFSAAWAWFSANGYGMAGQIDGGKRCSEAINDVCHQSRCYVTWDSDKVYLRVRFNINSLPITYASFESSRKTKSIEIERQDFAMGSKELGASQRQGGVINKLTVRYNKQPGDGDYAARYEATHPSSIGLVGEQAGILDAYLISDAAMAKSIGDFWVGETALPYSKVKFGTVGIDGALKLQIGDPVALYTEWTSIEYFVGMVVDLKRQLGQMSPSPRANTWDVLLAGFVTPRKKVSLSATMGFRGARATRGPLRVILPVARMGFRAAALVTHMIPTVMLYVRFGMANSMATRGPLRVTLPVARMGARAAELITNFVGGMGFGKFGNFFWRW